MVWKTMLQLLKIHCNMLKNLGLVHNKSTMKIIGGGRSMEMVLEKIHLPTILFQHLLNSSSISFLSHIKFLPKFHVVVNIHNIHQYNVSTNALCACVLRCNWEWVSIFFKSHARYLSHHIVSQDIVESPLQGYF